MNHKTICLTLLSLCLSSLLVSCGQQTEEATEVQATTVHVTSPQLSQFTATGTYMATVEPSNKSYVLPKVSGEVEEVYVTLGQSVTEGDLLVSVDRETAQEQCETVDRTVERAYEAQQAIYDSVSITAPISCYVRSVELEVGEAVYATSVMTQLVDSDKMKIDVPFLSSEVDDSLIGREAQVILADTGEMLTGTVTAVTGVPEYLYGNVQVKYVTISVVNGGWLQSGRSATASIGELDCSGHGTFVSGGETSVVAGMAGTLDVIYVKSGQYVQAGETMFRITSPSIQSQLNSARYTIEDALDAQEDAYEYLEDHSITAPISGTITSLSVSKYDNISQSTMIVEISEQSHSSFYFYVTGEARDYLSLGQTITLQSGDSSIGTITEIASSADLTTGLLKVVGTTENQNLLAGATVQVMVDNYRTEAITVPYAAVTFESGVAYVYLYEEGVARKVAVETGRFDADTIIVNQGITSDDLVITSWSASLRDGALVQMEEDE